MRALQLADLGTTSRGIPSRSANIAPGELPPARGVTLYAIRCAGFKEYQLRAHKN